MDFGRVGTPSHVMINNNIDTNEKSKVIGKILKEDIKDTFKLAGASVGTGAAVAGAVKFNNKFAKKLSKVANIAKDTVMNKLDDIKIKNADKKFVSVKKVVEDKLEKLLSDPKSLYSKFKGLPTYTKAGIGAAIATFVVLASKVRHNNIAKKGYIEGQAEKK